MKNKNTIFHVGDKVKVLMNLNLGYPESNYKKGEIAKVTSISKDGVHLRLNGDVYGWDKSVLELVKVKRKLYNHERS